MTHEHWTKADLSDLVTKLEARIAVLQTEALSGKCYFCGNRLLPAPGPQQDDPTHSTAYPYYRTTSLGPPPQTA